jgi:hypothetical protein
MLQVRAVLWRLLELCPTPEAAAAADAGAIRAIITPLGLHNKRATAVQRLSHDFVHKQVGGDIRFMGCLWGCVFALIFRIRLGQQRPPYLWFHKHYSVSKSTVGLNLHYMRRCLCL